MAGIYIPNKTMPKDCPMCLVAHWSITDGFCGCDIVNGKKHAMKTEPGYAESNTRPDWCPLIEVPDHGRLIDADAIFDAFYNQYEDNESLANWAMAIVNNAPTVIPADREVK